MLGIGGLDTWTIAATNAVKEAVRAHVLKEERMKHYVRNDFDEIYVKTALAGSTEGMKTEATVKKAAIEYWGRTKLLFGILDP